MLHPRVALLLPILDDSVLQLVGNLVCLLGLRVGALAGLVGRLFFSLSGLAWADHQVQLLRMCDLRQFEDVGGLLFDRSGSLLCAVLLYL